MELDEDKVVGAAAALDVGKDKVPDEWAVRPPGRAAIVSAPRADIVNHTFLNSHAPQNSARNVARG